MYFRIILALGFFISCAQENKDKNMEVAALAILASQAESQHTTSQLAQILGAINPLGGQRTANSTRDLTESLGFGSRATSTSTQNCMLGGTQTLSGNYSVTQISSTVIKFTLSNLLMSFNSCKQTIATIGSDGKAIPTEVLIEGSITRNVESVQETITSGSTTTVTMNGTESMKSSDYKVNGITTPEFDLVFKRENSKFTLTQNTSTGFKGVLEENAVVTGTIGGQQVNQIIKFTANFGN
jgi:hypothetical protein